MSSNINTTMSLTGKNPGHDQTQPVYPQQGNKPMKSVKLSRALARNKVFVRNARTGQLILKFRGGSQSGLKDRLFPPYQLVDQKSRDSYVNLSALYTAEQLKTSNLEDLIIAQDLELLEDVD